MTLTFRRSRVAISFTTLNVFSEPLAMTSRHQCKLFNWYHYTSHRFDEWLLLFRDETGKQVVTRFCKKVFSMFFEKTANGTRSIPRSSFAGAPKPREWRGQDHMQRGALMKLGFFGKQLCLFCSLSICNLFFGCEKPPAVD